MDESDKKLAEALELPPLKKKKKLINKTSLLSGSVFFILFVSTVIILAVVFAEVEPGEPEHPWWGKKPMYRILVESFQDSDGDGYGDIEGITNRLDYVSRAGFGAVWLSNILQLQEDQRLLKPVYNIQKIQEKRLTMSFPKHRIPITSFMSISPVFGNSETLARLTSEARKKDILVVMDLNPLWTSTNHHWFSASQRKMGNFTDFYIWSGYIQNQTMEGYGWTYDQIRDEYYLYRSEPQIAVLNLENHLVLQEMKLAFHHWSNLGVKGFNIGSVSEYMVNPLNGFTCRNNTEAIDCIGRIHAARTFAAAIHEFQGKVFGFWDVDDKDVPKSTLTLDNVLDFVVNIRMRDYLGYNYLGDDVVGSITPWISLAEDTKAVWMLGDEYYSRVASHTGPGRIRTNLVLEMLLPGGVAFYYGEELALPNNQNVSSEIEFSRTPMLWNTSSEAGFTNGRPWLPVHDNYEELCVETQVNDSFSHWTTFEYLGFLRSTYTGKHYFTAVLDSYMTFSRWKFDESEAILIVINFTDRQFPIAMQIHSPEYPDTGTVLIHGPNSEYHSGSIVNLDDVIVQPNEALVIHYYPVTMSSDNE